MRIQPSAALKILQRKLSKRKRFCKIADEKIFRRKGCTEFVYNSYKLFYFEIEEQKTKVPLRGISVTFGIFFHKLLLVAKSITDTNGTFDTVTYWGFITTKT